MNILISKLPHEIHCGDWHDRPLRWSVVVPENPRVFNQNFSTLKNSRIYARCVRRFSHIGFNEVTRAFLAACDVIENVANRQ
jgi:hypothetical protein